MALLRLKSVSIKTSSDLKKSLKEWIHELLHPDWQNELKIVSLKKIKNAVKIISRIRNHYNKMGWTEIKSLLK